MICYFCEQAHPGGMNLAERPAIGVCAERGVGVCPKHGRKEKEPGAPLLCPACAELRIPQAEPALHALSVQ